MSAGLAGRTALVTGGGSGLGRVMATRLAAEGAEIIVVGRRREPLQETARELGSACQWEIADVSAEDEVADLVGRLDARDVDILVNNAGVGGPVAPLVDVELDEFVHTLHANLTSVFLMCRALAPGMIRRGRGDIVSISSVAAKRPLAGRTAYCSSKAAVGMLTTTLAAELGPLGITVNTLSPGPVDSERMRHNFSREAERLGVSYAEAERAYVGRSMLQRMVTAEEVADALVAMLAMSGLQGADVDLSAGMVGR